MREGGILRSARGEGADFDDIQLLSPVNRGVAGVLKLVFGDGSPAQTLDNPKLYGYRNCVPRSSPKRTSRTATLCLLSLVISVIMPGTDNANADDCQRETAALAGKHVASANDLIFRYNKRRNGVVDEFLNSDGAGARPPEQLRAAIERVVPERSMQAFTKTYIDKVVADLAIVGDPEAKHALCNDIRRLEEYSDDSLRRLKNGLDEFIQTTETRIGLEFLNENEGLVAIAIFSFGIAGEIELNRRGALTGNLNFGPLNNEEYFEVRKLRAGAYTWEKVANRLSNNGLLLLDLSNEDLVFNVRPGVLNYSGVFVFDQRGRYAQSTINDRAAIVLTILEQRYPELLEAYEVHNGLVESDQFISHYLAEKRSLNQAAAQ